MPNYQIAQETDAQNGVTAEGCVKGLIQCSTPSQTGSWITLLPRHGAQNPLFQMSMSVVEILQQLSWLESSFAAGHVNG